MLIALSPYHLTTREAPAMAALLLAERVVTFMPGVMGTGARAQLGERARSSLRYARVMESWSWCLPLWRAGVIGSDERGDDAGGDIRAAWERVGSHEAYAPLRPFMKPELAEDAEALLEAVALDVLKGGPDPAISVPLAAGLDRFATRHGLVVARASGASVAQKAEVELATSRTTVVVPAILQGSGERVLEARDRLSAELTELRRALAEVARGVPAMEAGVRSAALAYERAFHVHAAELSVTQEPDELRVLVGPVSLTLANLPADAVLRSSSSAARVVLPGPRRGVRPERQPATTLPVRSDPLDTGRVAVVYVKAIGRPGPAA